MENSNLRSTPPRIRPVNKGKMKKVVVKEPNRKKIILSVSATVLGEAKPENLSRGAAYGFSEGGKLLGKAILNEKGAARLEVTLPDIETAQSLRVLVGPDVKENATVGELLRRGGEQAFVSIAPGLDHKDVGIQIIPDQILCWLRSMCVVHGQALKKVVSGGITTEMPVCDAIVEIYEVDPLYLLIPKLPNEIIERIRDFVINPPPPPPPPIEEEYENVYSAGPPPPQPLVFGKQTANQLQIGEENATKIMIANRSDSLVATNLRRSSKTQPVLAGEEDVQKIRVMAQTASTEQFRQVLIKHVAVVKPILCLFPFATPHMDLVATAKTNKCGKFKATFFRGCKNPDVPDLYFKVKQKIFIPFPPLTIYAPKPVLCHTFWDYQCGTQDVTLYVTNPLARTCPRCPPVNAPLNWVLFMAIGNYPLSKIKGTGITLASETTTENVGLTMNDAPFGEILRPRIEFDNSLREELGVKYYRVSYRKGTSGKFIDLTATINRHYTHEVGDDLVLEVYNLGPKSEKSPGVPLQNSNLYEIPPALPPIGQWSIPDAVEDTASAKFRTLDLAGLEGAGVLWPESGLYQLKVDLFDEDGKLVDIDALNIKFRVPTSTDLSGTIDTEDAANGLLRNTDGAPSAGLVQDDDGDGKKSMIIALHIDNSLCKAEIPSPTLDSVPAGDECGVMRYEVGPGPDKEPQGSVELYFRPEHPSGVAPNGFATYRLLIARGGNTLETTGYVPTPFPPATVSTTRSVKDLLGICDIAGFVEDVYVRAKATSGWRRLHEYDAHAVRGFVLAPKSKSPDPPGP
jgi:hypothetical protein